MRRIEEHRDLVTGLEYESVQLAQCPNCGGECSDEQGTGIQLACCECDWTGPYEDATYEADPDRFEE